MTDTRAIRKWQRTASDVRRGRRPVTELIAAGDALVTEIERYRTRVRELEAEWERS